MSNAIYAIAKSKVKPVSSWMTVDVDEVLSFGDKLYLDTAASLNTSMYLLAQELPQKISTCNTEFTLSQSEPMSGLLFNNTSQPPYLSIHDAIHNALCLEGQHDSCLIILSVYTFALLRDCSLNKHYVFDSHSRDAHGMACPNGTSVLMEVGNHALHVVDYINQLARSLGLHLQRQCKFEVVPINVQPLSLPPFIKSSPCGPTSAPPSTSLPSSSLLPPSTSSTSSAPPSSTSSTSSAPPSSTSLTSSAPPSTSSLMFPPPPSSSLLSPVIRYGTWCHT